jgi:hypothetical protein
VAGAIELLELAKRHHRDRGGGEDERHGRHLAEEQRHRHGGQRGERTAEEAQLAEELMAALGDHELVVAVFDALHDLRVLGVGLHRLGLGLQLILGDAESSRASRRMI